MKKLLSIILVLVLCTSLMAMTVSAAGYSASVSSHELAAGTEKVTVTLSITGNPGVGGMYVTPVYDSAVLKLDSINASGMNGGTWIQGNKPTWMSTTGTNDTYTGAIVTMEFTVLAETDTTVSAEISAGTYTADQGEEDVTFSVAAGSINFEEPPCTHANTRVEETASTCTVKGVKKTICEICGEVIATEELPLAPHTVGDWEKDANQHWHICSVCGQKVDAANHNVTEWTKNEKEEYVGNCTVCGYLVNKGKVVPAGDITPVLTLGAVAMVSMLAAVAFVFKRKFVK